MPNAELRMLVLMEDNDNDQSGGEREKGCHDHQDKILLFSVDKIRESA